MQIEKGALFKLFFIFCALVFLNTGWAASEKEKFLNKVESKIIIDNARQGKIQELIVLIEDNNESVESGKRRAQLWDKAQHEGQTNDVAKRKSIEDTRNKSDSTERANLSTFLKAKKEHILAALKPSGIILVKDYDQLPSMLILVPSYDALLELVGNVEIKSVEANDVINISSIDYDD